MRLIKQGLKKILAKRLVMIFVKEK